MGMHNLVYCIKWRILTEDISLKSRFQSRNRIKIHHTPFYSCSSCVFFRGQFHALSSVTLSCNLVNPPTEVGPSRKRLVY